VNFEQAIEYLGSFNDMERGRQVSENPAMSLESMRRLLQRLDNPQRGRQTVHITGSKGKGSLAGMLESVLLQSGLRTAVFTSPHLHSYRERFRFGGESILEPEFASALDGIRESVDEEQAASGRAVSTFGILTALFFSLSRMQVPHVDWQIVEVGLGGSFDATNVFEETDLVMIAPISLEHTAILGDTEEEIARDKAGIVKAGSVCVLAPQTEASVTDVVKARCEEVGASLIEVGELYEAEVIERFSYGQTFKVTGPEGTRELRTSMLGRHQVENAMTVVAAVEALRARGQVISEEALVTGLARARIHGRMEVLGQNPLVVADGAHNPASAEVLARTLQDYFEWRKCYFVIGCTTDKDIKGIGYKIAKLAELIVCCSFDSPRAEDPYVMIQDVGFLGPPAVAEDSVAAGIETALSHAEKEDLICVTGSLYVVAEARNFLLGQATSG